MTDHTAGDPLLPQLRKIEAWCQTKDVALVRGWLADEPALPEVVMSADDTERLDSFLQTVKQLEIKLLVLDVDRLTADDIDARLAEIREADEPDEQVENRVAACAKHVGHISMIHLVGVISTPAVALRCEIWPFWHDTVFPDHTDDEEDEGDEDGDVEGSDRDWNERHRQLGQRVADDPRIIGASNFREREWVVREVLGAEAESDRVSIYKVTQEAAAIVRLQVMPKLQKRAQELRDGGAKPPEIAEALGVSLKIARSLLR